MPIIVIITIAILLIVIELSWKNLDGIENKSKIIFIFVGIVITSIITLIIFNISKKGINYNSNEIMVDVKNMIVSIFTALNGVVFIPNFSRIYIKFRNKDIENSKIKFNILIVGAILVGVIFFECSYFNNIQKGILQIYNSKIIG